MKDKHDTFTAELPFNDKLNQYWLVEHLTWFPRHYLMLDYRNSGRHWTIDPSKATKFKTDFEANITASHRDEMCGAFEHIDIV